MRRLAPAVFAVIAVVLAALSTVAGDRGILVLVPDSAGLIGWGSPDDLSPEILGSRTPEQIHTFRWPEGESSAAAATLLSRVRDWAPSDEPVHVLAHGDGADLVQGAIGLGLEVERLVLTLERVEASGTGAAPPVVTGLRRTDRRR